MTHRDIASYFMTPKTTTRPSYLPQNSSPIYQIINFTTPVSTKVAPIHCSNASLHLISSSNTTIDCLPVESTNQDSTEKPKFPVVFSKSSKILKPIIKLSSKERSSSVLELEPAGESPPVKTLSKSLKSISTLSCLKSPRLPYVNMVHAAIVARKDVKGSSIKAITKYLQTNYEHVLQVSTKSFKTLLNKALKQGVLERRFLKLKGSYKISMEWKKVEDLKNKTKLQGKKAKEREKKRKEEEKKMLKRKKTIIRAKEKKRKEEEKKKEERLKFKQKKRKLEEKKKINEGKQKLKPDEKLNPEENMEQKKLEKEEKKRREQESKRKQQLFREEMEWRRQKVMEERKRQAEINAKLKNNDIERKKLEAQEAAKRKAKEKVLADKIKKRKFPMDDLELLEEDKELGVQTPNTLLPPPFVPHILSMTLPREEGPSRLADTPSDIVTTSQSLLTDETRGTISDVMQVYHFFRGDVGYSRNHSDVTPEFSFRQLLYAVNEIFHGNAKTAKAVPPLISHLFVTSLQIVTNRKVPGKKENKILHVRDESTPSQTILSLHADLQFLYKGLSEVSWGYILVHYMTLMERFYTSDATMNCNVLPGNPLPIQSEPCQSHHIIVKNVSVSSGIDRSGKSNTCEINFPQGFGGYLGNIHGTLFRAYNRLIKNDPWDLSADELMSLLRALTDDILATNETLAHDISSSDERVLELIKEKKAAESFYKKMRLAYEGPKLSRKLTKAKKVTETKPAEEEGKEDPTCATTNLKIDKIYPTNDNDAKPVAFQPTISKEKFVHAEKEMKKAVDTCEKGFYTLVTRTVPLGIDRNFNDIYFSYHNPDALFIEKNVSSNDRSFQEIKSWHVIDCKSLFQNYTLSLDIRGNREMELHDDLTNGYCSTSLKKYLFDDNKRKNLLSARKREEEKFEKLLNNSNIAVAAEESGERRSGRILSNAKLEQTQLLEKMKLASKNFEAKLTVHTPDYMSLTGICLIFDSDSRNSCLSSSQLSNKEKYISGVIGILISEILSTEELCNSLSKWDRKDMTRKTWINNLTDIAEEWKTHCDITVGPKAARETDSEIHDVKSNKTDRKILEMLKKPVLDLESRVYSMTGLKAAIEADEIANDSISISSSQSNDNSEDVSRSDKAELAWKKKIFSLDSMSVRSVDAIRDILISAIAITRKEEITDVQSELQQVLHLLVCSSAKDAKVAALRILDKYGGYEKLYEDESEDEDDENQDLNETVIAKNIKFKNNQPSLLCQEAMMLEGCLSSDINFKRDHWKQAVLESKTISRLAAFVQVLIQKIISKLKKMDNDRNTLLNAIKSWDNKISLRKERKKQKYGSAAEIWVDTTMTENFVMAKVEGYPWWPARIFLAKNKNISSSLSSRNRMLISFVGDHNLRVVINPSEIRELNESKKCINLSFFGDEKLKKLEKSLKMTQRILRSRGNFVSLDWYLEKIKAVLLT